MPKLIKILIVLLILSSISYIVYIKHPSQVPSQTTTDPLENLEPLPTMIEFGSVTCIPCKKMKPILDELTKEYAGEFQIVFVDVEVYEKIAEQYKIELWPTQVFLDSLGREIFRHEGFFPKADILDQWKKLGFEFIPSEETVEDKKNGSEQEDFFSNLTRAMSGSAWLALLASFVWGILSIVLSPCHLSSIPLVMAFLGQQGQISAKKAFGISSIFSFGILLTIAITGAITGLAGKMLGDIGPYGNYIVAVILLFIGLYLMDILPLNWNMPNMMKTTFKGCTGAFLLGLIFGIAVGPCTFAYMAPMLVVAFKVARENFMYAMSLIAMYGIGHCGVIILAGTSMNKVQSYLNWTEKSSMATIAKNLCGLLLIIACLYLFYVA